MGGLCEGGNEPAGSLKAICKEVKFFFRNSLDTKTVQAIGEDDSASTTYENISSFTATLVIPPMMTRTELARKPSNSADSKNTVLKDIIQFAMHIVSPKRYEDIILGRKADSAFVCEEDIITETFRAERFNKRPTCRVTCIHISIA
ncbi:hypothetical protein ANN_23750 [Periplaneta americana]|uniref:Uncharacterized protein n=1 Tax=Periplaneta americana TaxID=6978 RepID=A0ABQ8SLZ2_PERAM|nr:hypothetical protein ANN_23750 [Periplaneta americana]